MSVYVYRVGDGHFGLAETDVPFEVGARVPKGACIDAIDVGDLATVHLPHLVPVGAEIVGEFENLGVARADRLNRWATSRAAREGGHRAPAAGGPYSDKGGV
jgi:hypothetical protein